MSYLEMRNANLPNMDKGVISFWFRDATKNPEPAPDEWPSGLWNPGTASMVPPDVVGMVNQGSGYKQNFFPWNAYGLFISGGGIQLPLFGPAAVMMPYPPPFATDGMHMMLTFGNPQQEHRYRPWDITYPDVIEGVVYVPQIVPGPQWSVPHDPPPYKPWIQQYGKFKVSTMVLSGGERINSYVPQSFIGLDKNGYLTICLQTQNRARYQGYAFQVSNVKVIWATASYFDAPPHLTLGPGHWVKVPGYWDGYEYEYEDISQGVMSAAPEMFIIGGPPGLFEGAIPRLRDGAWHHVLFSFDISSPVAVTWPGLQEGGMRPKPSIAGACKAWLAVDGTNYKGVAIQHRFAMHDGFQLPLLPGMGTDAVGFGPVSSATRDMMGLGNDNSILPANAWIIGLRGAPKDGLLQFSSSAGLWEAESTGFIQKGDYNFFAWTGSIWTLEGEGGKDVWAGSLEPPRPSTPDPKKAFSVPTYVCDGFSLPVNGWPLGVPVADRHLKHNTGIEMAELQIWANKSIDTASAISWFIDKGKPAPLKVAREKLGRPDVLLHGSTNWKTGRNTGNKGMTDDGHIIPEGQFNPVAGIERFLPNPHLGQ